MSVSAQLGHLLARSWFAMVAETSTNTLGLAIWTVGLAACGWIAKRLSLSWKNRALPHKQRLAKVFEDGLHDAFIEAIAIGMLAFVAWGAFVPVVVYRDHVVLKETITTLTSERNALARDLEVRKNNIFLGDPAFDNIARLLQVFQMYRGAQKGKPCVLYITAMPDSMALASTVARLSNTVSGCFTFGPGGGKQNPDLDEMTEDDMLPGEIVIHVERDDSAGMNLQENLANQIPTRLSYTPSKIPQNRLYAGVPQGSSFVWLQFGTDVKWNSETHR